MNIYLLMTFGCIIGIILHAFVAIRNINKKNPYTKLKDVAKEYWSTEWLSVGFSLFCFFVLLFIASEFINLNHIDKINYSEPLKERLIHFKMSNFIKATSVLAGYFADSIVYGFLGKTEQALNEKFAGPSIEKKDE